MSPIEVLKAELAIANDRAAKAEARAQGFFKDADFFMRACDEQKKRAEAAEQQFSEYVERVEADLQFWQARADAAEKRAKELEARQFECVDCGSVCHVLEAKS